MTKKKPQSKAKTKKVTPAKFYKAFLAEMEAVKRTAGTPEKLMDQFQIWKKLGISEAEAYKLLWANIDKGVIEYGERAGIRSLYLKNVFFTKKKGGK